MTSVISLGHIQPTPLGAGSVRRAPSACIVGAAGKTGKELPSIKIFVDQELGQIRSLCQSLFPGCQVQRHPHCCLLPQLFPGNDGVVRLHIEICMKSINQHCLGCHSEEDLLPI